MANGSEKQKMGLVSTYLQIYKYSRYVCLAAVLYCTTKNMKVIDFTSHLCTFLTTKLRLGPYFAKLKLEGDLEIEMT